MPRIALSSPLAGTIPFLIAVLLSGTLTFGQTGNSTPTTPWDWEKTSYLAPSVAYLTNSVYLGRKDSLRLPYFGPALTCHTGSGFTLSAVANLTDRDGQTVLDMWSLEGGYDGAIGKHWQLGAYAGDLNYGKSSSNVRAGAGGYAGGYAAYDNDFVSPQVGLTAVFGSRTDWVTSLELAHEFDLNEDRISILPTAKCNAGTQHYYTSYIVTKLNKKGKPVKRNVVAGSEGYSVLDYELSAPMDWNIHCWQVAFTPTYFIPVNAVTLAAGQDTYVEQLSNSFTAQLSLSYRFLLRHHR